MNADAALSSTGPRCVLVLNAGSSSLKFAIFDAAEPSRAAMRGEIENLNVAPRFSAVDGQGAPLASPPWPTTGPSDFAAVIKILMNFVAGHLAGGILIGVGHRVVHGGGAHAKPERITPELLAALRALTPLDPIHLPHNLDLIGAVSDALPELPQVACYDTSFHQTMPPEAAHFALPRELTDAGVRRYGFHGLSYEFIARRLETIAPSLALGKVIVAHLGAGASLCALREGKSVATTMGFSALDGLVMATRCGSLDPGVVLYLARQGKSATEIEDILYRRSGLLGISGISGDMRVLAASADPRAREAITLFCHRAAVEIGALASALGGIDGLVFTAGIGENAVAIRADIGARLAWLGVSIDEGANEANAARISPKGAALEVRVIKTDEEAMIARHTLALVGAALSPNAP